MTHIKKYWILYTLLTVGIIWLIIWGMKRPSCGGDATTILNCPTNFEVLLQRKKIKSEGYYPIPANGKCPQGYTLIQPNCATAPCPAECFPLGDVDINQ